MTRVEAQLIINEMCARHRQERRALDSKMCAKHRACDSHEKADKTLRKWSRVQRELVVQQRLEMESSLRKSQPSPTPTTTDK